MCFTVRLLNVTACLQLVMENPFCLVGKALTCESPLWESLMPLSSCPALVSASTTSPVLVYPLLSLSAVSWDRVGWARLSTGEEKRNRSRIFLYWILWGTQSLRKIRVSTCSWFCLYVPKAGHLPLQHSSACHLAVSSARTQLRSWRTEA